MCSQEVRDVYSRLFNHRAFVEGEVRRFVKDFEQQPGDRDVEAIFQTLERVTELGDGHVDNIKVQCDSVMPTCRANLMVALSMADKILDSSRTAEIEHAQDVSRHSRDKEWAQFSRDAQDKMRKINETFRLKEEELRKRYTQMEHNLQMQKKGC